MGKGGKTRKTVSVVNLGQDDNEGGDLEGDDAGIQSGPALLSSPYSILVFQPVSDVVFNFITQAQPIYEEILPARGVPPPTTEQEDTGYLELHTSKTAASSS